MKTFIALCLTGWFIYIFFFSEQAKKRRRDAEKFWRDFPVVLQKMANDPDGDKFQKEALNLIDSRFFAYLSAVGDIGHVLKACHDAPDNPYNWFVLEGFLNKNILKIVAKVSEMFACCREALLMSYADKTQRDRLVAIIDKIADIKLPEFSATRQEIFNAVYQKALQELESATGSNKTVLKVTALEVGRLVYRDKITVQDEQKIQNDILMRS